MLTSDPANRRISVDAVRSVTHRSFKQRPAPEVGSDSCPEVRLWDVTTPSGVFQSKVVVHRLAEFLLAAEISVQWSEPRRAQAETESVQVLRPPNGITVHRCGASHGEQGF